MYRKIVQNFPSVFFFFRLYNCHIYWGDRYFNLININLSLEFLALYGYKRHKAHHYQYQYDWGKRKGRDLAFNSIFWFKYCNNIFFSS